MCSLHLILCTCGGSKILSASHIVDQWRIWDFINISCCACCGPCRHRFEILLSHTVYVVYHRQIWDIVLISVFARCVLGTDLRYCLHFIHDCCVSETNLRYCLNLSLCMLYIGNIYEILSQSLHAEIFSWSRSLHAVYWEYI